MMTDKMGVEVVLGLVDKITAPIKAATRPMERLSANIDKANKRLADLGASKGAIEQFRKIKAGSLGTAKALEQAQEKTRALGRQIAATAKPTKAMRAEFERARREVLRLKTSQTVENEALAKARLALKQTGISTRNLSSATRNLDRAIAKATRDMNAHKRALAGVEKAQARVAQARERMRARMRSAAKLGAVGAASGGIAYGASRMIGAFTNSIREVEKAQGELATLGVKDIDIVTKKGRDMQAMLAGVTSASFVRAAYNIKSGISTLTDDGVAAMTASAMMVAKATKAAPEQMTSLFATAYGVFKKQMADLSDADFGTLFGAALSKSVQQFKTDGPKMQQAIQSAGAGAVNIGMKMQEQLAVLGMMQQQMRAEEAGTALKSFAANAAHADDAFSRLADKTDNPVRVHILDEDGQLRAMPDILTDLKERYGDTLDAFEAAEIQKAFGTEEAMKMINALYGQEDAVRANAKALAEAAAQGETFTKSMAKAADNNFDAKMVLLSQSLDTLKQKIGVQIAPTIEELANIISNVTVWFGKLTDAHPKLASAIGIVVTAIGGLAAIMAPVFLAAAPIVTAFAMMRFAGVRMAGGIGKLGRVLMSLGRTVIPLVGRAIVMLGRTMLANPISLIITAIATAAFLIYKYWTPIKAFFGRLWDGVKSIFGVAWEGIKTLFFNYTPQGLVISHWQEITGFFGRLWDSVKSIFGAAWDSIAAMTKGWGQSLFAIGRGIIDGLIGGITAGVAAVKDTVVHIGSSIVGGVKEFFGIKSPSRVFMSLGRHLSQGLALGINQGEAGIVGQMRRIQSVVARPLKLAPMRLAAPALMAAATLPALAATPPAHDGRPAGHVIHHASHYYVTVNVNANGGDTRNLEAAIKRVLEEHDAKAQADLRRLLHD